MGDSPPVSDVSSLGTPVTAAPAAAAPASDVTSAGLLAEVTRERRARQALEAEVTELRKLRDDHSNLSATHGAFVEQMRTHNARRIEQLPEHARGIISALPPTSTEVDIARALDALAPILAAVSQPAPAAAPPAYPAGVQSTAGVPAPDELTPDERAWVDAVRPDLRSVAPAAVRKMFNTFAKGAKKAP